MRLLRFQDLPVMPWRNGGGVTREVAASKDPDSGDEFRWRLSIATVSADGPFSSFVGIDRTIAVLAGRGMALQLADRTVTLSTETEPFSFAGEAPVHAMILEGETTDLNAMTRRGWLTHTIRRLEGAMPIIGGADETAIVFGGDTAVETPKGRLAAGRFDTLVGIAPGERITVSPEPGAPFHLVEFFQSEGHGKTRKRAEKPL